MIKNTSFKSIKRIFFGGVGVLSSLFVTSSVVDLKQAYAMLPIIVNPTQNLNFGSFSCTGANGTVVISTAGARSVTGDVIAVAGSGLQRRGEIGIIGSVSSAIVVSMTATSFNLVNGTGVLVVDDFNIVDTDTAGATETITLTTTSSTIPFGATLNAICARPGGTYTGFYTISANYM